MLARNYESLQDNEKGMLSNKTIKETATINILFVSKSDEAVLNVRRKCKTETRFEEWLISLRAPSHHSTRQIKHDLNASEISCLTEQECSNYVKTKCINTDE